MKWIILVLFFSLCSTQQEYPAIEHHTTTETKKVCISADEKALIHAINKYRKTKRLPPVAISSSMSIVAQKHAKELNEEIKDLTHSWVDCPYKGSNPKSYECMWGKPRELTGYPGKGYECAFAQWGKPFTPEDILQGWKDSASHNSVITNKGIWKTSDWKAIGVAINGNYAVLWLGEKTDPKGAAVVCK